MNVVDVITFARILGAICILFTAPLSTRFFTFYSFCGICDVADGIIARITETDSVTGVKLDSISDIIFALVVVFKVLPALRIPVPIIIWIIAIAGIRFAANYIGYKKYKTYSDLHTYANKVTGFLIFVFPFFYQVANIYIMGSIICSIASISTVEELMIIMKSKKLDRNCRSIFDKNRY